MKNTLAGHFFDFHKKSVAPQPLPPVLPDPPHQSHSDTSAAAAARIKNTGRWSNQMNTTYKAILLASSDGITRGELEIVTGFLTQSLCSTLRTLEKMGKIRTIGKRAGPSGYLQQIYVVAV